MAAINADKALRNLQKKGFVKSNTHHKYYEFWYNGRLIAKTFSSHNNQDLNDYLLGSMAKQCLMPKKFFLEFARCNHGKEDYLKLLGDNDEL